MRTTIILARHGSTGANLENRFAGRSDEPLHRKGVEQLQAVAAVLKDTPLTGGIVCGPLARTRQSAEIVGRELDLPIRVDENLTEIAIPHWDGLAKDEIRSRFGSEYPTWLADPAGFVLPGCETLAQVQSRTVAAIERLFAEQKGRVTLVVSHLIALRCLVLHYRGLPLGDFRTVKIDNASLTWLHRNQTGLTEVGSG